MPPPNDPAAAPNNTSGGGLFTSQYREGRRGIDGGREKGAEAKAEAKKDTQQLAVSRTGSETRTNPSVPPRCTLYSPATPPTAHTPRESERDKKRRPERRNKRGQDGEPGLLHGEGVRVPSGSDVPLQDGLPRPSDHVEHPSRLFRRAGKQATQNGPSTRGVSSGSRRLVLYAWSICCTVMPMLVMPGKRSLKCTGSPTDPT